MAYQEFGLFVWALSGSETRHRDIQGYGNPTSGFLSSLSDFGHFLGLDHFNGFSKWSIKFKLFFWGLDHFIGFLKKTRGVDHLSGFIKQSRGLACSLGHPLAQSVRLDSAKDRLHGEPPVGLGASLDRSVGPACLAAYLDEPVRRWVALVALVGLVVLLLLPHHWSPQPPHCRHTQLCTDPPTADMQLRTDLPQWGPDQL